MSELTLDTIVNALNTDLKISIILLSEKKGLTITDYYQKIKSMSSNRPKKSWECSRRSIQYVCDTLLESGLLEKINEDTPMLFAPSVEKESLIREYADNWIMESSSGGYSVYSFFTNKGKSSKNHAVDARRIKALAQVYMKSNKGIEMDASKWMEEFAEFPRNEFNKTIKILKREGFVEEAKTDLTQKYRIKNPFYVFEENRNVGKVEKRLLKLQKEGILVEKYEFTLSSLHETYLSDMNKRTLQRVLTKLQDEDSLEKVGKKNMRKNYVCTKKGKSLFRNVFIPLLEGYYKVDISHNKRVNMITPLEDCIASGISNYARRKGLSGYKSHLTT